MWGTAALRSLVRLALWAALLCGAWLLLSPTQAQAAERPEQRPVADLVTSLPPTVASVAAEKSTAPRAAASFAPRATAPAESRVTKGHDVPPAPRKVLLDNVSRAIETPIEPIVAPARRALAPVVEPATKTASTTVDQAVKTVVETASAVPVLREPVQSTGDVLVATVAALPVVGSTPVVRLPVLDPPGALATGPLTAPVTATPTTSTSPVVETPDPPASAGAAPASPVGSGAVAMNPASSGSLGPGAAPSGASGVLGSTAALSPAPLAASNDRLLQGGPAGPDDRYPGRQALPPAPAPSSSGAGQAAPQSGDVHGDVPRVTPRHTPGHVEITTADRRVPTSLPTDPGSRPD